MLQRLHRRDSSFVVCTTMGLLRIVGLSILLLRLCNFCADAAPSLVDCVRTVTASDANNDGKLNYAEYLTLLSDLSLRESEENDDNNGDCVLDTTNIGFVTNHLFVEQFRELACLCEEYHDTSIQESEACHNRCQGSDPLVTVASDAYPAAYIVRLCDDVTDVLITACEGERETLFPIESPTEIPTVMPTEIPTETPTLMPTMLPTEAPTEVPTETPTAKPTVLPTETPTEIPTETPTVKPTVTPSVVPSKTPTVSPSIKASVSPSHAPTEVLRATAFPTASPPNPTLDLSTVAPIVVPIVVVTAVPTSGPAFNRDGGTGLAGGTVSSQVDDSISRNHRIVAIALPIFTVSALALFLTILLVQKTAKPLDDFQAFKDEDDDDDYDDDNSNQRKISRQSPRTPATDPTECSDTEPAVLEEGRGCSASYPDVVSVPDAPLDESSARSVPPGCDTDLIHSSPVDSKVRSIGHVEYEYPMDELSPIKMASSKTTNCDLAENDPILPATIPFTAKAAPKIPILAPSPLDKAPRFSLMLRKLKTEFTRRPDECPIVEYTQPLNDALPKSVAAPPPTASSSKLSSASSSPIFLFGDSEDDDDIIKNRSIASSRNSSRRRNGSAFTPIQHRFAEEEQYIAGSGESAGNFDDFGSSTGSSSSSSSSCDSDISGSEHSESASSNQQSDTQEIGRSENMRSERRIEATQVNTTEVAHPETAVSEESSSSSLDGSEVDTSSGSSASILDNHDDWDWRQGEENDQSLQLNQEVETNFNREDASASAFVTVAVGGGFEYHEMAWSTDPDIAGWETFPGNNSFREEDDVHIEESNESFEVVRRGDGVLSEVQKSL